MPLRIEWSTASDDYILFMRLGPLLSLDGIVYVGRLVCFALVGCFRVVHYPIKALLMVILGLDDRSMTGSDLRYSVNPRFLSVKAPKSTVLQANLLLARALTVSARALTVSA